LGPYAFVNYFLITICLERFKKGEENLQRYAGFCTPCFVWCFCCPGVYDMGTQYSLASNAAILTLSLPVITGLFAFLVLKEKMNKIRWISFIIAIVGVVLCSTGDIREMDFSSKYALGNLLIFLAIVGNAYYNVGIKKISKRYTEMEMVFFTYVIMVILLTPLVLYYESDVFARIPSFTQQTWVGMSLLTFFHNFLSMDFIFKALKVLDAIQVALSNYLITFIGLPVAAIWLDEKLNVSTIIGGILVFVSTLVITIIDYRMNQTVTIKPITQ
jgi:drug/metabolite transporter (DMT)-like permease